MTVQPPLRIPASTYSIKETAVDTLLGLLAEATAVRVRLSTPKCHTCFRPHGDSSTKPCTHARVGVLFSGGLDSTVVAALADR